MTTLHGVVLPRALEEARAEVLPGTAVVPGIAEGIAVAVDAFSVPPSIQLEDAMDPAAELALVRDALSRLTARLDLLVRGARSGVEEDLLRAHRSVAKDPEFRRHIENQVLRQRRTAAGAIASAEREFTAMLAATGSALLRERALDIRDVCFHLLREAYGPDVAGHQTHLEADSVCLADVLTPGQFLALDARLLKGLVLAHGGTTSHTVILARSRGVPTLVGVGGIDQARLDGRPVIVDADLGVLVTRLTAPIRRYYALETRRLDSRRRRQQSFADRPAMTADGQRVVIAANIAAADEAAPALSAGAEAIGLFRTEPLFVERDRAPGEEEQASAYRGALSAAGGRSIIIRTLDVGGDKPIPYLDLPRDENPFLGCRAVRIYPEFEPLFRTQLRALARASVAGRLRVIVPFVSRVEEARWVRAVLRQEQARLSAEGEPFDPSMELGAMIEVPSAAFLVDALSRDLDFFSVGTNDLLQYFTAVDRTNARIRDLYTASSPAFLRLLRQIVDAAHAQGRWIGLCGEMGGDPRYLPILVALGFDEISMAAPLIAGAKAEIAGIRLDDARQLLAEALRASTAAEVEDLLARPIPAGQALVAPELVVMRGEAQTKAEAIKEAVDQLYVAGRAEHPREVEEAVWRHEAACSTAFRAGLALLPVASEAVRADSIVVVKLQRAVAWGSPERGRVRVLILIAFRRPPEEASGQARALAALSRQVEDAPFRQRLEAETSAEALSRFIAETVDGGRP